MGKLTTKNWILLFAALFLLGTGSFLLLSHRRTGQIAHVYLDGEEIETIDLAAVAVPYSFTVETEDGYNLVTVSPGAIAVTEADCPDRVCVAQGEVSDGLVPIVCLPHKLVIQIGEGGA